MLWQSLWDGVRDGKLPLNEFIKTALANASGEKDYTLLGKVLGMISASKHYLDAAHPGAAYTGQATQAMEDQAWAGVPKQGGQQFLRRWFGHYMGWPAASRR
jgi:aminopeptidase N